MSITWNNYFDKIYCIHSVQNKKQKELMDVQLDRVGILNSGIFEWSLVYSNSLDNNFYAYIEKNVLECQIDISTLIGHYKIIRDAYFKNYNRILILEDNIKFLDDLDKIEQILQNKQEANIISYSNSTGCYQLDKVGMKEMINLLEKYPTNIDNYFNHPKNYFNNVKYYHSFENIVTKVENLNPDEQTFSKEVKITEDLSYILDDQIKPANMNMCFAVTNNHLDKLYTLIYSFKKYSQKNSKLNFHFITDTDNFETFEKQLEKFKDDRTTFRIVNCQDSIKLINPNFKHFHTFVSYMKLFIPILFPEVDKMLYTDYDTFLNKEGIENLFNLNIEDYYLAACKDNLSLGEGFFNFDHLLFKQYVLFSFITKCYISSGVMLINSKKIREDGMDKKITQFLKQDSPTNLNNKLMHKIWLEIQSNKFAPENIQFHLTDQSAINFIFTDNKKIISPIFNNLTPTMNNICYEQQLNKNWGFENYEDYFEKSIVYHTNQIKPWCITPKNRFKLNRYTIRAIQKYNNLKEEMEEVLK